MDGIKGLWVFQHHDTQYQHRPSIHDGWNENRNMDTVDKQSISIDRNCLQPVLVRSFPTRQRVGFVDLTSICQMSSMITFSFSFFFLFHISMSILAFSSWPFFTSRPITKFTCDFCILFPIFSQFPSAASNPIPCLYSFPCITLFFHIPWPPSSHPSCPPPHHQHLTTITQPNHNKPFTIQYKTGLFVSVVLRTGLKSLRTGEK